VYLLLQKKLDILRLTGEPQTVSLYIYKTNPIRQHCIFYKRVSSIRTPSQLSSHTKRKEKPHLVTLTSVVLTIAKPLANPSDFRFPWLKMLSSLSPERLCLHVLCPPLLLKPYVSLPSIASSSYKSRGRDCEPPFNLFRAKLFMSGPSLWRT
jgi:hypothetical protein